MRSRPGWAEFWASDLRPDCVWAFWVRPRSVPSWSQDPCAAYQDPLLTCLQAGLLLLLQLRAPPTANTNTNTLSMRKLPFKQHGCYTAAYWEKTIFGMSIANAHILVKIVCSSPVLSINCCTVHSVSSFLLLPFAKASKGWAKEKSSQLFWWHCPSESLQASARETLCQPQSHLLIQLIASANMHTLRSHFNYIAHAKKKYDQLHAMRTESWSLSYLSRQERNVRILEIERLLCKSVIGGCCTVMAMSIGISWGTECHERKSQRFAWRNVWKSSLRTVSRGAATCCW